MSHRVEIFFCRVSDWRKHKRLQKSSVHILRWNLFFFIKTICKEQWNLHICWIVFNSFHRLSVSSFLLVWFLFGFCKSLFSGRTFKIIADLGVHLNLQFVHAIMNTIQVDIRKRFKSNKIKQKSKSQKLFTCLSELTSSAEFEIVLETKPLVHRILVQIFVAVEFLNLSHQSEFICGVCSILVEAVCRIINLDSSHLFLLIDFILLVNFGS